MLCADFSSFHIHSICNGDWPIHSHILRTPKIARVDVAVPHLQLTSSLFGCLRFVHARPATHAIVTSMQNLSSNQQLGYCFVILQELNNGVETLYKNAIATFFSVGNPQLSFQFIQSPLPLTSIFQSFEWGGVKKNLSPCFGFESSIGWTRDPCIQ